MIVGLTPRAKEELALITLKRKLDVVLCKGEIRRSGDQEIGSLMLCSVKVRSAPATLGRAAAAARRQNFSHEPRDI